MALNRRSKKKISMINCSWHGSFGGAFNGIQTLEYALRSVGLDANFVQWKNIGTPDLLYVHSVGMNGEKNEELNQKRLDTIMSYYGKVPMVLCVHDFTEPRTFSHSYAALKDLTWDAIISIEPQQEFMDYTVKMYPKARAYHAIRHPWIFDDKYFGDRSKSAKNIVNTARFASTKRTSVILDIAKELSHDRNFILASREKGIYWFRNLKDHPNRKCVTWMGEAGFGHFYDVLKNAGFMIDLTYFWTKDGVDGGRSQQTALEAINCGCVPINFSVWSWPEGYEAIWLPPPTRQGNSFVFDVKEYSKIIKGAGYSFAIAKRNLERMKEISDHRVIARKYKRLFDELM